MKLKVPVLTLLLVMLFTLPAGAADYKVIIHTPHGYADYLPDPIIRNNRLLVPLRAIADQMKYQTLWDAKSKRITIQGDNTSLVMTIGNKTYTVTRQTKTMDTVPVIYNNRTYVPLRFVAEAFGYYVTTWEDYAYITFYRLIDESPWPNFQNDFVVRGNGYYLKPGVTTPLGIRLGQTWDEVLAIFGKPQRIIWTPENEHKNDHIKAWEYDYPQNFTGTLMWHGYFLPYSGVALYSLKFENGILTDYRP